MEKIPTAEEILRNKYKLEGERGTLRIDQVSTFMIEFAKLHVEACKRDIIQNIETSLSGDGSPLFSVTSVLNSYPLSNIK